MVWGGEGEPLPRLRLPDVMQSEDKSPPLKLYESDGGAMLAPSSGVYGRAGEAEGLKEAGDDE